jgi:hypothetical protein
MAIGRRAEAGTRMNKFARASICGLMLGVAASAASAIELPPAGNCREIAAVSGARGFWLGRFSGYYEDFFDDRRPIAAQGCFSSEYECRRWINEVQSAVLQPGFMSCRLTYHQ